MFINNKYFMYAEPEAKQQICQTHFSVCAKYAAMYIPIWTLTHHISTTYGMDTEAIHTATVQGQVFNLIRYESWPD